MATAIMGCISIASPTSGQGTTFDSLSINYAAPAVLGEARELLGNNRDEYRFVQFVVRTPNQAARYCDLWERYHRALRDDTLALFRLLLGLAEETPVESEKLAELAFLVSSRYAEQRAMMSVAIAGSSDSETIELGRICVEARNAVR